jgi:hypothetical protein
MSASISISEGADGALIAEVIVMLPLRNWARGYNNVSEVCKLMKQDHD